MKIIVIALLAALAVHSAADEDSKEEKNFKECLGEIGVKEEEFEQLAEANDPKLKCLTACLFEKSGILENGKLNKDALVKSMLEEAPKIQKQNMDKTIESCMKNANDASDICELSNAIAMCMHEILEISEEAKA